MMRGSGLVPREKARQGSRRLDPVDDSDDDEKDAHHDREHDEEAVILHRASIRTDAVGSGSYTKPQPIVHRESEMLVTP